MGKELDSRQEGTQARGRTAVAQRRPPRRRPTAAPERPPPRSGIADGVLYSINP